MIRICDFVRHYEDEMKDKGYETINTLWFSENERTHKLTIQIITKWLDHINEDVFVMDEKQEIELFEALKKRNDERDKRGKKK